MDETITGRGFLVHAWTRSGQVRMAGRLDSGESFALTLPAPPTALLVEAAAGERARQVLAAQGFKQGGALDGNIPHTPVDPVVPTHPDSPGVQDDVFPNQTFSGRALVALPVEADAWSAASRALESAGIRVHGEAPRPAEDLLTRRGIRGLLGIRGPVRPAKRVGRFWQDPEISRDEGPLVPLRWLALDIETSREGHVRAISLAGRYPPHVSLAAVNPPAPTPAPTPLDAHQPAPLSDPSLPPSNPGDAGIFGVDEVLFRGPPTGDPAIVTYASEAGLLKAFLARIQAIDPDVLTGWNVIDFDLELLCRRCAELSIPFLLGRSDESARVEKRPGQRTRCFIPGRQAVDAMQLMRGSGTRFEDQTLDTVAHSLLGTGKTVQARGEDKMAELDRLYRDDPLAFCRYCLEDSRLVIRILEKTGLDSLTQNRAALTGTGLDLAWTSIPTFERIYALQLWPRRILPPDKDEPRAVSGASGGMVLNPRAGLFRNVLVLDFRSLYPSIMRTFGIDPLSHEWCRHDPREDDIVAPNGARFRRTGGILPDLVTSYFEQRSQAQARGDETGAYVYKILMNSFYGVLGSGGCRYGRTELAGAITSFGRFWLEFSRDWFEAAGYRVLYGDTDSVFVATGHDSLEGPPFAELEALGKRLAGELNQHIADTIHERWQLESALAIRSEKVYGRFLIPRMRKAVRASGDGDPDADRGRAKGYAGLLLAANGSSSVEVKGMEAARSDWTALARRFQTEVLAMVFADRSAAEIRDYLDRVASDLRAGRLDDELVYKKMLRRNASAYERGETPQVRAARLLGWTERRGSVEYLMTTAGAEPLGRVEHVIDYEHYVGHQLLPIWDSIADAAGLAEGGRFSRQAEFEW